MEMRNLSSFVEAVVSSTDSGRPLSPLLREAIVKRNRTVCIAEILVQSLWNGKGLSGWVDPGAFKEMVRYIWHHVPDFFVEDDSQRIINEDTAQWNQEYLDLQRNYLRHNFSLRRLCHLVMVYEHLHGAEASVKKPSPTPFAPLSDNRYVRDNTPRPSRSSRGISVCIAVVVCVVLGVAASMCLLGKHDGNKHDDKKGQEISSAPPEVLVASAERPCTNQAQVCQTASDDVTNEVAKIPAQAEPKKAIPRSNEVVKTPIALQEVAPQGPKVPVLRPGNVPNEK